MPSSHRRGPRLCVLLALLALLALSRGMIVGVHHSAAAAPEGCVSGCIAGTAADEFTADRVGLVREWIVQVPTVTGVDGVSHVVVGDGLVLVQSGDGHVHAIRAAAHSPTERPSGESFVAPAESTAAPGSILWSRRLPTLGGPVVPATVGSDLVVVPTDDRITALERENGQLRWERSVGRNLGAGPVVVGNWIYVPLAGGDMMRYPVNPVRQPPQPEPAENARKQGAKKSKKQKRMVESLEPIKIDTVGRVAFSPVPLGDGVLWCTADGIIATFQPAERKWNRYEFALENPPSGPPVVRDRSVFAATTNGDLARIDLPPSGRQFDLVWHVVLPTIPDSGPFVSGNTVVVSLGDEGLAAYAADTGAELWRTCIPGRILAVGGDRVWCLDRVGRLSGFDLADGTRRDVLCLGAFTEPVVNVRTDRLILVSRCGAVVSLAPKSSVAAAAAAAVPAPADGEQPADKSVVEPAEEAMPADDAADPDAADAGATNAF
jgi:outer membrane protein assembly factor BamB